LHDDAVILYWIIEDLIEIQDVALLNESEEWTDDVYSLSASVMDGVSICWRFNSPFSTCIIVSVNRFIRLENYCRYVNFL